MRRSSLLLTLTSVCALAAAAIAAGKTAPHGGVNWVAQGFEAPTPYDDPAALASLNDLKAAGVTWVTLSFPWYIDSVKSTGPILPVSGGCPTGAPFNNASSPSNASVVTGMRAAKALGLRVVLRPMVDPHFGLPGNAGASRGQIGDSFTTDAEWAAWWASYNRFLAYWAGVAAAEHADVFCIGAELSGTEKRDAEWRAAFAAVRAAYSGMVYYSASSGVDLSFWDVSDFIAVDSYPALTNASVPPSEVSIATLVVAWQGTVRSLAAAAAAHNKSVLLQETGICSIEMPGLYAAPWYYDCYQWPLSEDAQAKYYESVFQALWAQPWLKGVNFWKWGAQGGPSDPTFFPWNKTAMAVMKKYLL